MEFEVLTTLGFVVRTTESYWQRILLKHPDLSELEDFVKDTLSNPDEVCRSKSDEKVFLFYCLRRKSRWVVAVARRLNGDAFLITAYQTDAIKEGEILWRK